MDLRHWSQTVFLLAATVVGVDREPGRPVDQGTIAGRVIDAVTAQPIGGAVVTLRSTDAAASPVTVSTQSRDGGEFVFQGVPTGRSFRLEVAHPDYARSTYPTSEWLRPTSFSPTGVALTIRLWPLAEIQGTVTGEDAQPIARMKVAAMIAVPMAGSLGWAAIADGVTDDRGRYRISSLPPGQYKVGVFPRFAPAGRSLPVTFYAGARRLDYASPVTLVAGQTLTNIDLEIAEAVAFPVSGRVEPGACEQVNLTARLLPVGVTSASETASLASVSLSNRRTFSFESVPQGDYVLEIRHVVPELTLQSNQGLRPIVAGVSLGRQDQRDRRLPPLFGGCVGRVPLNVTNGAVADVVVPIRRGVKIEGAVRWDESSRPPSSLQIILDPAGGRVDDGMPVALINIEGPSDSIPFSLDGVLPGPYFIRVQGRRPLFVKELEIGGVTRTADRIEVTDVGHQVVNLQVSERTSSVAGRVTAGGGRLPEDGVWVVVFPDSPEQWSGFGIYPARLRVSSAGTDGTFSVGDLPPGAYRRCHTIERSTLSAAPVRVDR